MKKIFIILKSLNNNMIAIFIVASIFFFAATMHNLIVLSSFEKDLGKIPSYLLSQIAFSIIAFLPIYFEDFWEKIHKERRIYSYIIMFIFVFFAKKLYPPNALIILPSLVMLRKKIKYSFLTKCCMAIYGLLALSAMIYVFFYGIPYFKL